MTAAVPASVPDVPFYANQPDNMQCMLAVYRMVVKFYLHKELSWEELAAITGYTPGKAAWSVQALTILTNDYGLSIRMIEPFDYRRFASEGKDYLYDLYDNEEVEWNLQHTNILEMPTYITKFLASVRPECRRATLADIDAMLAEGRLVQVQLNSNALNDVPDIALHSILIIGRQDDSYVVHDPGVTAAQAQANRLVPRTKLWDAMGGDSNTAEVTGFMLRKAGLRLDQYVVQQKPTLSRAYAVRLISEGRVLVNGATTKAGFKLRDQDAVAIDYNAADEPAVPDIDLPVLYEDDDCIVINKPAGVLTHNKGVRYVEATVASFVRSRSHIQVGGDRPGIVHRLDRGTSGVIIAAKNAAALSWLQKQFHDRAVQKVYAAVVSGQLKPADAIIDMPIERNPKAPASFRVGANGKTAITTYHTLQTSPHYSLLELQPKTGRTHQLRVHLASQHHPIVGDVLYDGVKADRLFLHAQSLTITLPNGQTKTFSAPVPSEFPAWLEHDGAA